MGGTGWILVLWGCGGGGGAPAPAASEDRTVAAECAAPEPALHDDAVVARWDGGQVTWAQVRGQVDPDLRAMDIQHAIARFDVENQALDALVVQSLLEAEAARLGEPDVDTLLLHQVEQRVPDPSDAEIASFYPVVARQLGGASLDESAPFLRQELSRRAQDDAFDAYIADLKARAKVTAELPYPELPRVDVPIAADDPVRGAADAPVTIVEFAEYQCYYCGKVAPTIDRLLEDYPGKVRLVLKDYPLSGHNRAAVAAVAAHCAGEQGKYWEMSRSLLDNQDRLSDADLDRYAESLGVDLAKFDDCRDAGRYEPLIQRDIEQGHDAGVQATPAFFVNGLYLSGAQPYERFAAIIDREL
jgi:protein-disulfide isomerase